MNNILVTFKKNNSNKYTFKATQNGKVLYNKEYVADKKYNDTDLVANQADAFSAFVDYVQDRVNAELNANPKFGFDDMEQLKRDFPQLTENNLLLQYLTKDYSTKLNSENKPEKVNIKLRVDQLDKDDADILTEDFEKLLNFVCVFSLIGE